MLVEPTADDLPENNFNLIGQMYYSFSTIACIPASKSQEVGLALGAQAGPQKLFSILNEAGFKKSPTKELPNFLVKIMSFFVGELKTLLSALDRKGDIDKTKAERFFNWD